MPSYDHDKTPPHLGGEFRRHNTAIHISYRYICRYLQLMATPA